MKLKKDEKESVKGALSLLFLTFFLSGLMLFLSAIPDFVNSVDNFLPFGEGFAEALLIILFFCFAFATLFFSNKIRAGKK